MCFSIYKQKEVKSGQNLYLLGHFVLNIFLTLLIFFIRLLYQIIAVKFFKIPEGLKLIKNSINSFLLQINKYCYIPSV